MTFSQWKKVADTIVRETERRTLRGEVHAKDDALLTAIGKHDIEIVFLDLDGKNLGLVDRGGSKWALFVGPSRDNHHLLVYMAEEPNGQTWTSEDLFKAFWEAYYKSM